MSAFHLPKKPVMNKAFAERGRCDVVKIDVLSVPDGGSIRLTFESKDSPWRQGVWMSSDQYLVVNGMKSPSVDIWEDTAPKQVDIECHSNDGCIHLYNIWDRGKGRESQLLTSGMLVERVGKARRYRCNDIGYDTEFKKIIFLIEFTGCI